MIWNVPRGLTGMGLSKSAETVGFVSLKAFVLSSLSEENHSYCNSLVTCQIFLIKVQSWSHRGDSCTSCITINNAAGTNGSPLTAGAYASEGNSAGNAQGVGGNGGREGRGIGKACRGWLEAWKCNQFLTCCFSDVKFFWFQWHVALSRCWCLWLEM